MVLGDVDETDVSRLGRSELVETSSRKHPEHPETNESKLTTDGLLESLEKPDSELRNQSVKSNSSLEQPLISQETKQPAGRRDTDTNDSSLKTLSTVVKDGDKNASRIELNEQQSEIDDVDKNISKFITPSCLSLTEHPAAADNTDKANTNFENVTTVKIHEEPSNSILENIEETDFQVEERDTENGLSEELNNKELCNKDVNSDDLLTKDHSNEGAEQNDQQKDNVDSAPADDNVGAGGGKELKDFIDRLGYRNMTMEIFHKLRETFGTEECEFCGKLFYSKTDFEPHVRTHTGNHLTGVAVVGVHCFICHHDVL